MLTYFLQVLIRFTGHLERLFHRHEGWKFHNELADNYAGVAKINGALGVGTFFCTSC